MARRGEILSLVCAMSRRLFVLFTAATLALFTLALAPRSQARDTSAPSFELVDCHGKPVTLEQYRGKPLVLNFWASWCPPCQVEIPALSSFSQAHPEVAVVGVAVDSGPSDHMPELRTRLGIPYEIYAGTSRMLRDYGVRGLPTTIVVDGQGQVVNSWTGPVGHAELERMVSKAR